MGMFGAGGSFNKPGGFAEKLGGVSDLLTGNNFFGQRQAKRDDLASQMEIARMKANAPQPTDVPSVIRTLQAAGIDPQSQQGRSIIERNLAQPRYMMMGSPETGQTLVNPDAAGGGMGGGAPSGPPSEAVAQLRANPASAAQFDEIFGAGAAARAMGGQ